MSFLYTYSINNDIRIKFILHISHVPDFFSYHTTKSPLSVQQFGIFENFRQTITKHEQYTSKQDLTKEFQHKQNHTISYSTKRLNLHTLI